MCHTYRAGLAVLLIDRSLNGTARHVFVFGDEIIAAQDRRYNRTAISKHALKRSARPDGAIFDFYRNIGILFAANAPKN